jgi:hypothetical protein
MNTTIALEVCLFCLRTFEVPAYAVRCEFGACVHEYNPDDHHAHHPASGPRKPAHECVAHCGSDTHRFSVPHLLERALLGTPCVETKAEREAGSRVEYRVYERMAHRDGRALWALTSAHPTREAAFAVWGSCDWANRNATINETHVHRSGSILREVQVAG